MAFFVFGNLCQLSFEDPPVLSLNDTRRLTGGPKGEPEDNQVVVVRADRRQVGEDCLTPSGALIPRVRLSEC